GEKPRLLDQPPRLRLGAAHRVGIPYHLAPGHRPPSGLAATDDEGRDGMEVAPGPARRLQLLQPAPSLRRRHYAAVFGALGRALQKVRRDREIAVDRCLSGSRDVDQPLLPKETKKLASYPTIAPRIARMVRDLAREDAVGGVEDAGVRIRLRDDHARARAGYPTHLRQRSLGVAQVREEPLGPAAIEGRVGEREVAGIAQAERDRQPAIA